MKLLTQFKKLKALAEVIGLNELTDSKEVELYRHDDHFCVKVGDVEIETHANGPDTVSAPLTQDFNSAIEATETALDIYIKKLTDALTQ